VTGFSRSGSVLHGVQESPRRPEHLFIQPEIVGVAFGSLLNPSTHQTMWARHSAYHSTTPPDFSSVLHPEGLRFLGAWLGWSARNANHITPDPRIQEMRISRSTIIWIIKRILSGSRHPYSWQSEKFSKFSDSFLHQFWLYINRLV
jgi:hypothetical protein